MILFRLWLSLTSLYGRVRLGHSFVSVRHYCGRKAAPLAQMDNDLFYHEPTNFFPEASLPNNGSFGDLPNVDYSDQAQHYDNSSQFVRAHDWWPGPFGSDLTANIFRSNNLQPDELPSMSHASNDYTLSKGLAMNQHVQAPPQGGLMVPSSSRNMRTRGIHPSLTIQSSPHQGVEGAAIRHEPERPMGYKRVPFCTEDRILVPSRYMAAFGDPLRPSDDVSVPSIMFRNHFTAEDLGGPPPLQDPDDTATIDDRTRVSCNSRCTSSICGDENCSVTGVPCDDPTCMENTGLEGMLGLENQVPTRMASEPMSFFPTHAQPCNHTESEHDAVRILGGLRAPTELGAHENAPLAFNSPLVSRAGEQFFDGNFPSYPSPPDLPMDLMALTSNDAGTQLRSTPPLVITPSSSGNQERHICQWVVAQDEHTICGAEFTNTKEFHEHLCGFHIDKMASQTGFACLWDGCPRKQDKPFVTRGKLRRHVSTHSVCKSWLNYMSNSTSLLTFFRQTFYLQPMRPGLFGATSPSTARKNSYRRKAF